MVIALTGIIVLLVSALVVVDLSEISALARAGAATENVVAVTRSMVLLFRMAFSFLGIGVLALLGAVRTHSKDPTLCAEADRKTGKITQLALVVAVVAGIFSMIIVLVFIDPFLLNVVNKPKSAELAAHQYVNWIAPSLPFYFASNVLQTFCLQTGYIGLVVIDSALDLFLFTGLIQGWAIHAPVDAVVHRVAVSNFLVVFLKFAIYFCFVFRKSLRNRFHLLDFGAVNELRSFLRQLGWDVLWQWLQNLVSAFSLLAFIIFANRINETAGLAFNAATVFFALSSISGNILSFYVTYFGSRFLGDKRYAGFWGIVKFTRIWVVILTAFSFVGYEIILDIAIGSVTDPSNKARVDADFSKSRVRGGLAFAVIFGNFALYYRSIFLALHHFKTIFFVVLLSYLSLGIPFAALGMHKKSVDLIVVSAFLFPSIAQCIGFILLWHLQVSPQQQVEHSQQAGLGISKSEKPDLQWRKLHEALGWPDIEATWKTLVES